MNRKTRRLTVASCLLLTLLTGVVLAEDLATSFEFNDLSGEFILGESPLTVTFTGGEAKSIGNFALYHSGTHAWMISAGGTGTITFETPAREINLFLRDESSSVGEFLGSSMTTAWRLTPLPAPTRIGPRSPSPGTRERHPSAPLHWFTTAPPATR
jgi:hypothetical protein